MTNVKIIDGNIFTSRCQTLVNTVNCEGVMGAGIALECRLRYPEMLDQYVKYCSEGKIDIGILWLFKSNDRWILNFPTKKSWRLPSKEAYLHAGLRKFMDTYQARKIQSIAFPALGAQHGGFDTSTSIDLMKSYLSECTIPVEIYRYSPMASDDLYSEFKFSFMNTSSAQLKKQSSLKSNHIKLILSAMENPEIHQLNQLAKVDGIGVKTLEKAFAFTRSKSTLHAAVKQPGFDF